MERALYALADQVTGSVADRDGKWVLTAHPRAARADLTALEHRLRQEVNDQTLRVKIAQRTDPLRNLVFALAFSRAPLAHSRSENGGSAETHPTEEGNSRGASS
ncbi:hypothetical protein [Nocardioides mangrovicus]|uniref:hypothetical protein n=1 Tax=Nocardioides mangrovicus TaxID=2478913 RepID=UPI0011C42CC5|nr:hypothetical protein [Nocardioides mangrovicus]